MIELTQGEKDLRRRLILAKKNRCLTFIEFDDTHKAILKKLIKNKEVSKKAVCMVYGIGYRELKEALA